MIDRALKLSLLHEMTRIRLVEEEIALRYPQGKMRCPTHLSIGQEAVAVAAGKALNIDDFAISTHRAHAHYLAKGGNLKSMIAEIYGKASGCSKGRGGSMHLIDLAVGFQGSTAIVGNSIPIGVGLALSIQIQNSSQISCVFLGDGSTEEGVFYESVNFAVIKNLPVLFICENNLYSVYSPLHVRQPKNRKIYEMVSALGLRATFSDGNDVESAFKLIDGCIKNIRDGAGPQFIELATYRWREHCGPNYDNDIGYRSPQEFEAWKLRDPVSSYKDRLISESVITQQEVRAMYENIRLEITDAFEFAETSAFPDTTDVFTHLYKD